MAITIGNIKYNNAQAGYHFFEAATMRFFNSRILQAVYQGEGGVFFVTSEKFDERSPRLYTVRKYDPATRSIDTVDGFNELSKYQAQAGAARMASGDIK